MDTASSPDWTVNLDEASATHVSGLTVVALPGRGHRYRAVPLTGTLPVPGEGLSADDCEFLARVVCDRVREGCNLLLNQLCGPATSRYAYH
ncbi:hypothetical protein [Lysobacter sp. N42]|jgi:hypothetical protein|uniref:hypothetical protein n=1 Tax=Lysobacter sp. N42 TaxID=2545719 RepID=UPI00104DFC4B|nr:hypothetical protein [Lysobacter sp. N42]TCZ82433.1 hypothetical protein EYQ95_22860 [Lysobacter sp. N42]